MPEKAAALAPTRGPITIAISASTANNLDKLNKGLANLAERLGHTGCLSGANCFFQITQDYLVINPRTLKAETAGLEVRG
ncbi:MAG TPA: hypothetical protein VMW27_26200 [Thermoanaerobaculia bacterium]|nr:hypothetical protein [Thermoanaerobaculia bacterium]